MKFLRRYQRASGRFDFSSWWFYDPFLNSVEIWPMSEFCDQSTKLFFFSTAYRRWHVPDSFPKTSSWKIAFWPTKLRVTNHQQSQSDDTYQKSRDLFFSHFQPSDFMGEIQASTSLLVAGDATLHNEHEGKSMEVRSQLLVDDVPQAGEPKRVNMFER